MRPIAGACRVAGLVVAVSLIAAPAIAAPITYLESVSGDLPNSSRLPRVSLTLLLFELGSNIVSGRLGGPDPLDSFAFVIPGGTELVSARVELVDVVPDVQIAGWWFKRGSTLFDGGSLLETVAAPSPGSTSFGGTRRPGTYNLSNFGIQGPNGSDFLADYTFTFDLAPQAVPEAGMLALISIGLTGFSSRRRWRR